MSVKHIVLGLLEHAPAHGYRVSERLGRSFGTAFTVEPSRVYAVLAELERDGLVLGHCEIDESRRSRRSCEATAAGRAELRAWLARPGACRTFLRRPLLLRVAVAAATGACLTAKTLRAERAARERLLRNLQAARTGTAVERLLDARLAAHLEVELWLLDRLAGGAPPTLRRAASASR